MCVTMVIIRPTHRYSLLVFHAREEERSRSSGKGARLVGPVLASWDTQSAIQSTANTTTTWSVKKEANQPQQPLGAAAAVHVKTGYFACLSNAPCTASKTRSRGAVVHALVKTGEMPTVEGCASFTMVHGNAFKLESLQLSRWHEPTAFFQSTYIDTLTDVLSVDGAPCRVFVQANNDSAEGADPSARSLEISSRVRQSLSGIVAMIDSLNFTDSHDFSELSRTIRPCISSSRFGCTAQGGTVSELFLVYDFDARTVKAGIADVVFSDGQEVVQQFRVESVEHPKDAARRKCIMRGDDYMHSWIPGCSIV